VFKKLGRMVDMAENKTELNKAGQTRPETKLDAKAKKIGENTVVDQDGKKGKKKLVAKDKEKPRKKRKGFIIVFILVFLFVIIGGAVLMFIYDFFSIQGIVFEFLHNLDPDYAQNVTIKERNNVQKEAELEAFEEELNARQTGLDIRQRELDEAEASLESAQGNINPIYWPPVNEEDIQFMEDISTTFAAMEPVNAADIMVRLYDVEDMAAIIYYMDEDAAGAILESMSAVTAAQITNALLRG
jgi:flagellar motility protein MotE (MotC chaperone)